MPERKAVDYHDIQLDSGEDTPTTSVKLMLAENEQGSPLWKEGRLKPLPMRISQGEIRYAHFDPLRDLVFSQKSWHGGALQQIENPSKLHRYLQANGLDMRHEGVATLGMARSQQISILVPNRGFETGTLGGWGTINTPAPTVVSTDSPYSGSYHAKITGSGADPEIDLYFDIAGYSNYVGRTITVGAMMRMDAGNGGIVINQGNAVTSQQFTNNTYQYNSISRTITAGATALRIAFFKPASIGGTIFVDDVVVFISGNDTCVGTAEARGKLYAAVGPLILRWNETNDFWESMYVQPDGVQATDIISFNDRIYVAYGYS